MESITNSEAIELRELVRDAKARSAHGLFVVEGPHLVEAALEDASELVQMLLVTLSSVSESLQNKALKLGIEVRSLTAKNAERISDTRATQGVFAVVRMPKVSMEPARSIVAMDTVQDPGNVGTIVRTASWFGVEQVLASSGTADLYSQKVIRATQGALFAIQLKSVTDLAHSLQNLRSAGYAIIGASLTPKSIPFQSLNPAEKYVLVLGSEARGMSPDVEGACTTLVTIPRIGRGESLNVAVSSGIILARLTGLAG